MRKQILFVTVSWLLGSLAALAQGTIVFNNLDPSNGRVFMWAGPMGPFAGPLNRDLNFELMAGPPDTFPAGGGRTPTLDHIWLLGDGTAKGINVSPGVFADPSGTIFVIPGVKPGEPANVEVFAWDGPYNNLGAAMQAGAGNGVSFPFTMVTGSAATPPAGLRSMPPWNVYGLPEPGTLALIVVGGLALAFFTSELKAKRVKGSVENERVSPRTITIQRMGTRRGPRGSPRSPLDRKGRKARCEDRLKPIQCDSMAFC